MSGIADDAIANPLANELNNASQADEMFFKHKEGSNRFEFTGGENINNSLYSGGSSLIGLNYAFGP